MRQISRDLIPTVWDQHTAQYSSKASDDTFQSGLSLCVTIASVWGLLEYLSNNKYMKIENNLHPNLPFNSQCLGSDVYEVYSPCTADSTAINTDSTAAMNR